MTETVSATDLTVVGAPFVDLVFDGLQATPHPGREILASRLVVSAGGTALQAIASARAGASTALVSARGRDPFGAELQAVFLTEGVRWQGSTTPSSSVTAVLPAPDGTAMVTVAAPGEPTVHDVATTRPRAVLLSIGRRHLAPDGAATYLVTGQLEVEAGATIAETAGAEAVIVNEREAAALTGEDMPDRAVRRLADAASVAVVTVGARGALAMRKEQVFAARPSVVSAGDATGAGDVFAGTLAGCLVLGIPLEDALERAVAQGARAAAGVTALSGLGARNVSQP